jgi:hypothetical protein
LNESDASGKRINQKNWLWFDHDGFLHLIYMTDPHEVVRWNPDMTVNQVFKDEFPSEHWNDFGHARGGTPPVLIDGEYWLFFHSSTDWKEWNKQHPGDVKRRYHMGAYAFEARPPFRVTRVVDEPLLTGSQMDPWATGLPLVVFPGGAILRDGKWFVVMGVNDCACAWIEIPHNELMGRMICFHENEKTSPCSQTRISQATTDTSNSEPAEDHRNKHDHESVEAKSVEPGGSREVDGDPGISGHARDSERPVAKARRGRRIRRVPWSYRGVSRGNSKSAATG